MIQKIPRNNFKKVGLGGVGIDAFACNGNHICVSIQNSVFRLELREESDIIKLKELCEFALKE